MSLIAGWTYPPQHLESIKWHNRILLLFAASAADPQLAEQVAMIEPNQQKFEDRDLLVFTVPEKNLLRNKFKVEPTGFTLILIGKDGTEKLRKRNPVPASEIVQLIDSMPMRRAGGR